MASKILLSFFLLLLSINFVMIQGDGNDNSADNGVGDNVNDDPSGSGGSSSLSGSCNRCPGRPK
jgi:hypothetical protein